MEERPVNNSKCIRTWLVLGLAIIVCTSAVNGADIETIPAGDDLLMTLPGTVATFPGFPDIPLMGQSPVSTIVHRDSDMTIPDVVGSTGSTTTRMTLLALQSVTPVNIGGSFFDIFVDLTPGAASTGSMTLLQTVDGEGTTPMPNGLPGFIEGDFSSTMALNFTVSFALAGTGQRTCLLPNGDCSFSVDLTGRGVWTDTDAGGLIIAVTETHPFGVHEVQTFVPEPATAGLLGAGLLVVGIARRKRNSSR